MLFQKLFHESDRLIQVSGTPTVRFLGDRELLKELKGVKQKSKYYQIIERHLPAIRSIGICET